MKYSKHWKVTASVSRHGYATIVNPGLKFDSNPLKFVPPHVPSREADVQKFEDFLKNKQRLVVLTGAGISTESGIPDYRSEGVGLYATSSSRPIQYQDFINSEKFRQRYWARNYVGWPNFSQVQPNFTHKFLAKLEQRSTAPALHWLVTQNVDGLHLKAGARRVTELHGSAFQVGCLSCQRMVTRIAFQDELRQRNPDFHHPHASVSAAELRPDADVELTDEKIAGFTVVSCAECGGIMKPNIVYFGENVPKRRVDLVFEKVTECDGLLVLGSSLQVFSGYRFALRAAELGKPICIVNIGPTRADHLASERIDRIRCTDLLSRSASNL
ncbi:NAD-dependent protein deacylase sir-2.2-like [Paramacrobiotus metropolitanus]|uniref:NAD-dependent protein deacylase sir-2.2-like n=1 Tax=Paramacrobiotus metropolitanus TaxID=2943436 RepID=UPI002445F646|nr:NAD-dependent protein deacylase sir-2.2-like [Paramacrobiotus metropolitanus]